MMHTPIIIAQKDIPVLREVKKVLLCRNMLGFSQSLKKHPVPKFNQKEPSPDPLKAGQRIYNPATENDRNAIFNDKNDTPAS